MLSIVLGIVLMVLYAIAAGIFFLLIYIPNENYTKIQLYSVIIISILWPLALIVITAILVIKEIEYKMTEK